MTGPEAAEVKYGSLLAASILGAETRPAGQEGVLKYDDQGAGRVRQG
jgi:hypothetical protein